MQKVDLRDGMILETRIKAERVYINGEFYLIGDSSLLSSAFSMKNYDNNLIHLSDKDMDIVKISYQGGVLWERDDIDWTKIPVDTKVLVREDETKEWYKRYFAKYEDGLVYTFLAGANSWTNYSFERFSSWSCYKLADEEIDWTKIPVDTRVLVRDDEYSEWKRGNFAKYENGKFYVFSSGRTSWNKDDGALSPWNYCKLANNEILE